VYNKVTPLYSTDYIRSNSQVEVFEVNLYKDLFEHSHDNVINKGNTTLNPVRSVQLGLKRGDVELKKESKMIRTEKTRTKSSLSNSIRAHKRKHFNNYRPIKVLWRSR
jgi:hypothetical protein